MDRRLPNKLSRPISDYVAAGIAITVMLGVIISSTFILIWPIPDRNETLVGQMQGSLWTALGVLVTYYFGSNKAMAERDETISSLANTVGKAEGKALEVERSRPAGKADSVDIDAENVKVTHK